MVNNISFSKIKDDKTKKLPEIVLKKDHNLSPNIDSEIVYTVEIDNHYISSSNANILLVMKSLHKLSNTCLA